MTEKRSTGESQGEPDAASAASFEAGSVTRHLEAALESAADPDARYHVREAIQLLRGRRERRNEDD